MAHGKKFEPFEPLVQTNFGPEADENLHKLLVPRRSKTGKGNTLYLRMDRELCQYLIVGGNIRLSYYGDGNKPTFQVTVRQYSSAFHHLHKALKNNMDGNVFDGPMKKGVISVLGSKDWPSVQLSEIKLVITSGNNSVTGSISKHDQCEKTKPILTRIFKMLSREHINVGCAPSYISEITTTSDDIVQRRYVVAYTGAIYLDMTEKISNARTLANNYKGIINYVDEPTSGDDMIELFKEFSEAYPKGNFKIVCLSPKPIPDSLSQNQSMLSGKHKRKLHVMSDDGSNDSEYRIDDTTVDHDKYKNKNRYNNYGNRRIIKDDGDSAESGGENNTGDLPNDSDTDKNDDKTSDDTVDDFVNNISDDDIV